MKDNIPLVSVILTSYNHQDYIKDAIESVLNQSLKDIEIVIIDDFSNDDSFKIIENYSKKYHNIVPLRNKQNLGVSTSINRALSKANSDYIAFISSDDVMSKERLEKQLNYLKKNKNYSAVFSKVKVIDHKGKIINHVFENIFNTDFLNRYDILNRFFKTGNFLNAPSSMVRKNDLLNVGGFRNSFWQLQDFDLWLRLLLDKKEFYHIDECLTFYRIHQSNLSSAGQRPPLKVVSRDVNEHLKCLELFLKIDDIYDFKKIFPECVYKNQLEQDLIPFYLGIEAYRVFQNTKNPIFYTFAYSSISKIFDVEKYRERLSRNHNYLTNDFLELANSNPYSQTILNLRSPKINFYKKLMSFIKKKLNSIF